MFCLSPEQQDKKNKKTKKTHPDVEQTLNPLQPQKALFKEHSESTWSDFQHNTALRDGLAGRI